MQAKKNRATLTMLSVAVLVVVADQAIKYWVRHNLPLNQDVALIPWLDRLFTFTYVRNFGASFGILQGSGRLFVVISAMVIALILYYSRTLRNPPRFLVTALGLQLGGAFSNNLIDRLFLGYVVDYINFRWWPVWNLADASIVIGTGLLLIFVLFFDRPAPDNEPAESSPDVSPDGA